MLLEIQLIGFNIYLLLAYRTKVRFLTLGCLGIDCQYRPAMGTTVQSEVHILTSLLSCDS